MTDEAIGFCAFFTFLLGTAVAAAWAYTRPIVVILRDERTGEDTIISRQEPAHDQ